MKVKNKTLKRLYVTLCNDRMSRYMRTCTQTELRHLQRALSRTQAEVAFYLDIRNEQGRGGK